MSVAILLPTYNGENFLREQVQSIVEQTYPDWTLVIRDDGSSDATESVVKSLRDAHPNIVVIDDESPTNVGVKRSVLRLLESIKADYYMFCDQDDVWLPTKIESAVRRAEEEPVSRPLLVYTDLVVVDRSLHVLRSAMHRGRGRTQLSQLLVENSVTGCTVLINRSLRDHVVGRVELSDPRVIMHDWWLAVVASALGKVAFLNERSILYRQHGHNTVGATSLGSQLRRVTMLRGNIENVRATLAQASLLQTAYARELPPESASVVNDWLTLPYMPLRERLRALRRRRFAKNSLVRTANFYMLTIFFARRLR